MSRHQSRYVTAKEIAADPAVDLSDRTIRRRLNEWGLNECRDRNCAKPLRFDRERAREKLQQRGFPVEF